MAESRPPTFKAYGVKPVCHSCGRKLSAQETLWFTGAGYTTPPAVFGRECWKQASMWTKERHGWQQAA